VKIEHCVFKYCDKQLTINVLELCEKPETWDSNWRDNFKGKVIWDFGGKNIVED